MKALHRIVMVIGVILVGAIGAPAQQYFPPPAAGGSTSVAFLAYLSGASTVVNYDATVPFNAEAYDVGNNFASNVFTAPSTGIYMLCTTLENTDGNSEFYVEIVTSNRTYAQSVDDGSSFVLIYFTNSFCVQADMDAADTAYVRPHDVSLGQATFAGGASPVKSWFSGYKLP